MNVPVGTNLVEFRSMNAVSESETRVLAETEYSRPKIGETARP